MEDVGSMSPAIGVVGRGVAAGVGRQLTNGLYSRLDEAAKMLPKKGVPASGVMNWLKKSPEGINPEEAVYRKLDQWLSSQGQANVTPEMLASHLQANPAPFPKVKTYGVPSAAEDLTPTDVSRLSELESVNAKMPLGAIDDTLGEGTYTELMRLQNIRDRSNTPGLYEQAAGLERQAQIAQRAGRKVEADRLWSEANHFNARAEALELQGAGVSTPTKFAQYQVPGGENYRETLLTLPEAGEEGFQRLIKQRDAIDEQINEFRSAMWDRFAPAPPALVKEYNSLQSKIDAMQGQQFRSSHFPDDPNPLVHTRSNERTLPSGERIRFGEEVQSDAFQLAKKEGYRDSAKVAAMEQAEKELAVARTRQRDEFEKLKEMSDRLGNPNADNAPPELMQQLSAWKEASKITDQADTVYREAGRQTGGTIPDTVAPLEGEWPNLGIKQMLIEAANDPKIDGVGFTGANTQIKRWGTERLAWEPTGQGGFRVSFEPQVGGNAAGGDMGEEALRRGLIQNSNKTVSSLDELTELLGGSEVKAEKAWKRMNAQPEGGIYQPRAEGMTHFYDETGGELRNRAAKIVKPFGGTVEQGAVSPNPARKWPDTAQGRAMAMTEDPSIPMWLSRLTPEMKAAIKKGVPLMSIVAAALSAGLISTADAQQIKQQGYQ